MARTLLLDLDGTLVDTVPDLTAAVNRLMRTRGHAPKGKHSRGGVRPARVDQPPLGVRGDEYHDVGGVGSPVQCDHGTQSRPKPRVG